MHLTPITMEEFLTNLYRFVNSFQLHSCPYLKYGHFALSSSQQGKMTHNISLTAIVWLGTLDLGLSMDRTDLLSSQFKNSNELKSKAFPKDWKLINVFENFILKSAMRRAGANPTDVEITDIINKADNDTGYLDFAVRNWSARQSIGDFLFYSIIHFQEFCTAMTERNQVKATIRLYENICVELFTYI